MLLSKSYNSDSSKESSALTSPLNLFAGCTGIEGKKKPFGLAIFHILFLMVCLSSLPDLFPWFFDANINPLGRGRLNDDPIG